MQGSPLRPPSPGSSSMEIRLAEGQGRFQSPGGGAATAGPSGLPAGSPTSDGLRSEDSDAAEYSENARLVGAALSDDGMTPLIQVRRVHGCGGRRWRRCGGSARQRLAEGSQAGSALGSSRLQRVFSASGQRPSAFPHSPPPRPAACLPACLQPARTRQEKLRLFCKRVLSFLLSHWSKAVILAVIITLIVLVSIKASCPGAALYSGASHGTLHGRGLARAWYNWLVLTVIALAQLHSTAGVWFLWRPAGLVPAAQRLGGVGHLCR